MTDELANSIQLFLQQEKMLGAHVLTVIQWRTNIRVGHISIAVFLHCKGFCCQSELAAFGPEALSRWGRGSGPKMERLRLWLSSRIICASDCGLSNFEVITFALLE